MQKWEVVFVQDITYAPITVSATTAEEAYRNAEIKFSNLGKVRRITDSGFSYAQLVAGWPVPEPSRTVPSSDFWFVPL
jgi:hypothetical protein